jgi:hypothetical protein
VARFTALILLGIGLVYGDLDADNPFYRLALPALTLGSLLYLFWYKAFLALAGAVVCYHFMDLQSQSLLQGGLLPMLFGLCVILFLLWSGLLNLIGAAGGGDGGSDFFGDAGGGDGGGD